jgi:hypothetical protein
MLSLEPVLCENYYQHDPTVIFTKTLAIIFIVVKMASTLHQKQVLLYSEEYHFGNSIDVISHPKVGHFINWPFGFYIVI